MNHVPPTRRWNWLWSVPVGCLALLVALAVFTGGIFMVVRAFMRASDPYKVALQRAEKNAQVTSAVGTPIAEGWFITGSISVAGGSGQANLAIPISGPKQKATIYVVANKSAGVWVYRILQVRFDSAGETIDLREH